MSGHILIYYIIQNEQAIQTQTARDLSLLFHLYGMFGRETTLLSSKARAERIESRWGGGWHWWDISMESDGNELKLITMMGTQFCE